MKAFLKNLQITPNLYVQFIYIYCILSSLAQERNRIRCLWKNLDLESSETEDRGKKVKKKIKKRRSPFFKKKLEKSLTQPTWLLSSKIALLQVI